VCVALSLDNVSAFWSSARTKTVGWTATGSRIAKAERRRRETRQATGFVGFTQALLMSGTRSVCLSLWNVNDRATSLLMTRSYQNLLGRRAGLSKGMPKAEALREAKQWLRSLTVDQIDGELAALQRGDVRPLTKVEDKPAPGAPAPPKSNGLRPYDHPYYWAAFVLVGDPD
jgi:CHAT domain-containing protein